MPNIKIIADSSGDMSDEFYAQHQISIVPFYVTFDKSRYLKERIDINNSEFYRRLCAKDVFPSTSQPTIGDYEEVFQPCLEDGMDVICVCLSSKFSGSYQSAVNAQRQLMDKYPARRIAVIDSIQFSGGQGLIISEIVKLRDQGVGIETIVSALEKAKEGARVFFTVDSLEHLQRGGRIGKAASLAGALLQIKPIIAMKDGELTPLQKIRGRKNSIKRLIDIAIEYVGGSKKDYSFVVIHSDCRDEAQELYEQLLKLECPMEYQVQQLGITIGTHAGPTMVGISLINHSEIAKLATVAPTNPTMPVNMNAEDNPKL